MIDSIWNYIINFQFNSLLGVCLYWIPVGLALLSGFVKCARDYMRDVESRDKDSYYSPRLTLGQIVWRFLVSFIPVVNMWVATFNAIPYLFQRFCNLCESVFNIPIVPKRVVREMPADTTRIGKGG